MPCARFKIPLLTSLCKGQIFSWYQSAEWACEEQSEDRPRRRGARWSPFQVNISWTRPLGSSSSSVQSSNLRWSEVSLLLAELRAIGGVNRLSMVELEDEGGEGESAKGKRGTPLRGGGFYHCPLCALLSLSLANCRRK